MTHGVTTFGCWAHQSSQLAVNDEVLEKLGRGICTLEEVREFCGLTDAEIFEAIELAGQGNVPSAISRWLKCNKPLRIWSAQSRMFKFSADSAGLTGFCTHDQACILSKFNDKEIYCIIRDAGTTDINEVCYCLHRDKLWKKSSRPSVDDVRRALHESQWLDWTSEPPAVESELLEIWLDVGPGLTSNLLGRLAETMFRVAEQNAPTC